MVTVVLVDVSVSMATPVLGGQRRIDVLRTILRNVITPEMHVVAFSDATTPLEPGQPLPEPSGSTDLSGGLEYVTKLLPRHVIIISDGRPNDEKAAFAAARTLRCVINTYFCGDEDDKQAISFLKSLALCSRGGVGRPQLADLRKPEKLTSELRLLLAAPS